MTKYRKIEKESLSDLSPQRIREISKLKYQQQIKTINSENPYTPKKYQEKVVNTLMRNNPVAYLLGYNDAIEEHISQQEPEMKNIQIPPEMKNKILNEDDANRFQLIITLQGLVDPREIKDLIEESQKNDISLNEFIQLLENLIEEASNNDKVK